MTKTFTKALLSGVAVAIVASFTVAANAQCAWPTMTGQCLAPPPGGSIIAYPPGPWERQAYVPGNFPGADTIQLSR